ncbi:MULTISPECIES: TonB-dependent receptor [unclassified Imperialibacter]|uniref:TonB-dependent receptor n=1 Tax=unclassified Imperialibacter TaxID=2629706 RepID=UPI00125A9399|nr:MULTISPECIES: TonB-dependent receptor [unclassified Imperialibacter]CAD5253184.1 Outer membrane receptor proteins, mostly Fe transport [Imperialibacter sp. 75]CAD5285112.1 Outer membrane receptor proteins, mostly Fe transport [Imperialibacter sp. 89]VVT23035.1 Outer membrane receptor proteins, mostly Fe transport [Imperialibacter sp. EC-SDR9]
MARLVLIWMISCYAQVVLGQASEGNATITGKVTSTVGEKLIGASVLLKGTTAGTITSVDGSFEIVNIPAGTYVLQAHLLGFEGFEKEVRLAADQRLKFDILLEEVSFELDNVEVVGKSESTEVRELPYAVSVINTKNLYNSTSNAKEVLNRVPGVRAREDGGVGSNLSFTLNGFSGDQVKFFLDGIPMDNYGSSLSLNNIPVNTIERIEVYKGVVPVWLGTDALGGAVNIVSNKRHNFIDASYSLGSFNTHLVSLNGAYTHPQSGFTVRGNANINYSDNSYKVWVPIKEGNNIVDSANVRRFHDQYRSGTVKLETGVVNKPYADNLLLGMMVAGNDKEVQTGATMNSVYGGIVRNSQSVIPSLKYSKENLLINGFNLSVNSAFNATKSQVVDTLRGVTYNWLGEAIYTPNSNDGELSRTFTTLTDGEFNSQVNAGYTINTRHSLAFNRSFSHFEREVFDKENPDRIENQFPKSINKQVMGLAYKFDASEKWSTTLFGKAYLLHAATSKQFDFGLPTQRTEATESKKQNLGYGMASTYFLVPRLQMKVSYEHTYRMPWATEIFGDGLFVQPNPDLGPEQSDNLNLGAAYQFTVKRHHQLMLESSFVYRESKDLIYQVVRVASPETYYENLAQTKVVGMEGSVSYQWKKLLRVGGNVTFQDITDQADSVYNESYTNTGYQRNFQKGYRLPNTPYFFGHAHAGLTFQNVTGKGSSLNANYYFNFVQKYFLSWAELGSMDTKKIIPQQASHDVELSLSLRESKYNISLECRNLANARLYDKYYLQKPGRAFYLKLRYTL